MSLSLLHLAVLLIFAVRFVRNHHLQIVHLHQWTDDFRNVLRMVLIPQMRNDLTRTSRYRAVLNHVLPLRWQLLIRHTHNSITISNINSTIIFTIPPKSFSLRFRSRREVSSLPILRIFWSYVSTSLNLSSSSWSISPRFALVYCLSPRYLNKSSSDTFPCKYESYLPCLIPDADTIVRRRVLVVPVTSRNLSLRSNSQST